MKNNIAYAIWFKGTKDKKPGFCFWGATGASGMFFETKKDARDYMYKELTKGAVKSQIEEIKKMIRLGFVVVKVGIVL